MTPHDREKFFRLYGYNPCFKSWGPGMHCCNRAIGHTDDCVCKCGKAHRWEDEPKENTNA